MAHVQWLYDAACLHRVGEDTVSQLSFLEPHRHKIRFADLGTIVDRLPDVHWRYRAIDRETGTLLVPGEEASAETVRQAIHQGEEGLVPDSVGGQT